MWWFLWDYLGLGGAKGVRLFVGLRYGVMFRSAECVLLLVALAGIAVNASGI